MKLSYITTPTPVGDFHMILDEKDIVRVSGFGSLSELKKRVPAELLPAQYEKGLSMISPSEEHPYSLAVKAYFKGNAQPLDAIPHQQEGTAFTQMIWKAMSKIEYGKTVSYQQLADSAGATKAVRAVGTACGNNLLALIVPCHRIIRSDGQVGQYYYGPDIKEKLLKHEGSLKTM